MVEIKDEGREFHWSRPRIVGLILSAVASPIYFIFAALGHQTLGVILWFAACFSLLIGYVRPTRFRGWMQRLIPTTAEARERAKED